MDLYYKIAVMDLYYKVSGGENSKRDGCPPPPVDPSVSLRAHARTLVRGGHVCARPRRGRVCGLCLFAGRCVRPPADPAPVRCGHVCPCPRQGRWTMKRYGHEFEFKLS